jgi:hypothetical protein
VILNYDLTSVFIVPHMRDCAAITLSALLWATMVFALNLYINFIVLVPQTFSS